jgi:hypothetical protein
MELNKMAVIKNVEEKEQHLLVIAIIIALFFVPPVIVNKLQAKCVFSMTTYVPAKCMCFVSLKVSRSTGHDSGSSQLIFSAVITTGHRQTAACKSYPHVQY